MKRKKGNAYGMENLKYLVGMDFPDLSYETMHCADTVGK